MPLAMKDQNTRVNGKTERQLTQVGEAKPNLKKGKERKNWLTATRILKKKMHAISGPAVASKKRRRKPMFDGFWTSRVFAFFEIKKREN